MLTKGELRSQYKKTLQKIGPDRRQKAAFSILSFFDSRKGPILSFASFRLEIDLWPLNHLLATKKQLVLPYVDGHRLQLYFVDDLSKLSLSPLGIFEPQPEICEKVSPSDVTLVLAPGLAFDLQNYRLGYGKGHYDRLLPTLKRAEKIGVGFFEQKTTDEIPRETTDYPLESLLLF